LGHRAKDYYALKQDKKSGKVKSGFENYNIEARAPISENESCILNSKRLHDPSMRFSETKS